MSIMSTKNVYNICLQNMFVVSTCTAAIHGSFSVVYITNLSTNHTENLLTASATRKVYWGNLLCLLIKH